MTLTFSVTVMRSIASKTIGMLFFSAFNEANYIKSLTEKASGDYDEIPVLTPDMERGVPHYRTDALELLFRSADQMHETAASILGSLALPE